MKIKNTVPIFDVVWQDAYSTDGWTDHEAVATTPHIARSVGWLAGESKDILALAGTTSEDGQACCIIHIPKAWIKNRKRIR